MTIKIYHNIDGSVKITKISASGLEQPVHSNIREGQVAILDVTVANLALQSQMQLIEEDMEGMVQYADTRSSH